MPSKRTRTSSRRTKKSPKKKEDPKNHHNEQDDDDEEDREVWPVLIIVIRVMIASWFIYSACDRFLRKDAWAKYITYQNANFARMGWSTSHSVTETAGYSMTELIFFIVSLVELVGAILFLFGFEKIGIDCLIAYLLFTGIVLHHFWVKGLESSTMSTLAFTQILTVLGLLLYIRETLYKNSEPQPKKQKVKKKVHQIIEHDIVDDDFHGAQEDQEEEEEEVEVVKVKKKATPKKAKKKKATLARIRARVDTIDYGTIGTAEHHERDDLQRVKGIGPFIEEKLHALDIYTFLQISKMNDEIEHNVNVAIEFFIGRIRRDEWRRQAQEFVDEQGYD